MIDFESFCSLVNRRLNDANERGWDASTWRASTRLRDDLLLDSLDLLRVGIMIEEAADYYLLDLDVLEPPQTVGDLYAGYQFLVAAGAEAQAHE